MMNDATFRIESDFFERFQVPRLIVVSVRSRTLGIETREVDATMPPLPFFLSPEPVLNCYEENGHTKHDGWFRTS